MAATNVYVPRMNPGCFLPPLEVLKDQQKSLTQAPFKILLLPCISEHVRFLHALLRVESLFPTAPGSPDSTHNWSSKPNFWGLIFLVQDHWDGYPYVGFGLLTPWGEPLQFSLSPHFWVA